MNTVIWQDSYGHIHTMHCVDDVERAEEVRDEVKRRGLRVIIAHNISEWEQFVERLELEQQEKENGN